MKWNDNKPYYSLNQYYKDTYGDKVYKIALDIGTTCPNRDGTLDTRGCIFCSSKGSGDYAVPLSHTPSTASLEDQIHKQIATAIDKLKGKYTGDGYVAYLQSFTNTYGDPEVLKSIYTTILAHPRILALNIATRPDCLSEEILSVIQELNGPKKITIELGLQTIHDNSAAAIRRCYPLSTFTKAVKTLNDLHIDVVVHLIAGLPGESKEDFLESVRYLSTLKIQGIKLQMLHILKDTDLGKLYNTQPLDVLSLETYADWIVDAVALIPQDIVIHRITGDGNKEELIEPLWSLNKRNVLNTLHRTFIQKNKWQGSDLNNLPKEGDTL